MIIKLKRNYEEKVAKFWSILIIILQKKERMMLKLPFFLYNNIHNKLLFINKYKIIIIENTINSDDERNTE